MSHLKERKEKDCLNCGAAIHGRFCHVCGQENIEPKESFWHLVTHFMYDVTHFDGKFFSTLKYLLFRPGFLSHEYLRGRRASYLHPIRMYVFTSALFFLILFTVNKEDEVIKINSSPSSSASIMKRLQKKKIAIASEMNDTLPDVAKNIFRKQLQNVDSDIALLKRDSTAVKRLKTINNYSNDGVTIFSGSNARDSLYKNVHIYDSIQGKLPPSERDNFLRRRFARQNLHLREKYNNDNTAVWKAIFEKFKHLFPQMLFASLPLFALMLRLLYVRRKRFFYVNHVVFTIHLYCGTFIIILAGMAVEGIFSLFHGEEPSWLKSILILVGFFYLYKCMRNFYEQRRAKTVLKYFLVLFLSLIIMTLLFTVFFIFSAMTI